MSASPTSPAVGQLLRKLLEQQGLRITDLIERTGLPRPTVSRHVNGRTLPSYADRKRYAQAFGLSMEAFEQGWRAGRIDRSRPAGPGVIPVINRAPAGLAVNYEETGVDSGVGLEYIDQGDLTGEHLFAVILVGDSMNPALLDGDYAVFESLDRHRPDSSPRDGEIVFIRFDQNSPREGCMVARWFGQEGDQVRLQKDNPRYAPVICSKEELVQVARLVEYRRKAARLLMHPD
ncbi:MAG: LexA family transcriptional regulator [Phycisphaeraceae bacterium]|nr:LexA family transcriptional regulator [Phycisphaeraceae bacterium]